MGILVDYFAESDDDAAAAYLNADGPSAYALDGRQIEPTVSLSSVEEFLGGRTFDAILDDEENSFVIIAADDDDAVIVRLGALFEQVLGQSTGATLDAAALQWAQIEEMLGSDPADLREFLGELQSFVLASTAAGQHIYCRVSP
jgi:hypothetical protein